MQRTIQQHSKSRSTYASVGTEVCLPSVFPPGKKRCEQQTDRNKTYRRPRRHIPTFVVIRAVRGRLAVVLRGGIRLGGVEGVVRVRLEAGFGGVGADLKEQPTVSSRNATKNKYTQKNNGLINKTPFRVPDLEK